MWCKTVIHNSLRDWSLNNYVRLWLTRDYRLIAERPSVASFGITTILPLEMGRRAVAGLCLTVLQTVLPLLELNLYERAEAMSYRLTALTTF